MKHFFKYFIITLILFPIGEAAAEVVVVANPKAGVVKLSRDDVINIFLGRFRQYPSGLLAYPMDLPVTQPERELFYKLLVNKELAEINSYWARLVLTGRTAPPKLAGSNEELLRWVAATPGGIGYIERERVDARVKVVFEFSR